MTTIEFYKRTVELFSINLTESSLEQLQDELKKIKELKGEILTKQWYEQLASLRDWEKKVIEMIELKQREKTGIPK